MKEYTIHTLPEYITVLESISIDYQLSRGQSNDLPLLPSALRRDSDGKCYIQNQQFVHFLTIFKLIHINILRITLDLIVHMNGWYMLSILEFRHNY